jgi:hypothetical protein
MAVLSRPAHDLPADARNAPTWWQRLNERLDVMQSIAFNSLMSWLCRASRGYLCPPDMPSIMYPEDSRTDARPLESAQPVSSVKRCCNEELSGK